MDKKEAQNQLWEAFLNAQKTVWDIYATDGKEAAQNAVLVFNSKLDRDAQSLKRKKLISKGQYGRFAYFTLEDWFTNWMNELCGLNLNSFKDDLGVFGK